MTQQSAAKERKKRRTTSPAALHTSSWKLLQCWMMTAVPAMNCMKIVPEIMDEDEVKMFS
jgi:hypothetical protein